MPPESVPPSRPATPARTPGELARETLKVLASRRIAPTPENYVQVYAEIAGTPAIAMPGRPVAADADPTDWSQVIRDLLRQLEVRHAAVSLAQKREGLERLLINFRRSPQLGEKLASMVKAWGEPLPSSPGSLRVEAEPAGAPDAVLAGAAPGHERVEVHVEQLDG